MNLKEFSKTVYMYADRCRFPEETTVGIMATHLGSAGGTPLIEVKSAFMGADWDSNRFIIVPETNIRSIEKNEIESIKKELSELGWTAYEFNNLKRENKKLRKEIAELKGNNI